MAEDPDKPGRKGLRRLLAPVPIVIIIVIAWAGSGVVLALALPDWPTREAFGGSFQFINALFSGLALAGVVYAILLQREELRLQRTELEANRRELKRSARAQELSEQALHKQVDAQKLAAHLNALTAVLSHYDQRIARVDDPQQLRFLESRQRPFSKRLMQLLEQLEEEERDDPGADAEQPASDSSR
jgi:hypothetical protein